MTFISWNCRGLGAALTVKELKGLCLKFKSQVCFLTETRMKEKKLERIRRRSFGFGNAFYVNPIGLAGGIALWWNEDVNIQILYSSKNIVHTVVLASFLDGPCFVSFVYMGCQYLKIEVLFRGFCIV